LRRRRKRRRRRRRRRRRKRKRRRRRRRSPMFCHDFQKSSIHLKTKNCARSLHGKIAIFSLHFYENSVGLNNITRFKKIGCGEEEESRLILTVLKFT